MDGDLFTVAVIFHAILYISGIVLLARKRWPITAGLMMLVASVMPIAAQVWFTDSDMPGTALVMIVELPLALLVLAVGMVMAVIRIVRSPER